MRPALIYDICANFVSSPDRVLESQSVDSRPFDSGIFVTVAFAETTYTSRGALRRGPQAMTIAVHKPWQEDRDYAPLTDVLNRIQRVLKTVENVTGTDGVRVTQVIPNGRSGNDADEGWETITRTETYGVLYDETSL